MAEYKRIMQEVVNLPESFILSISLVHKLRIRDKIEYFHIKINSTRLI